MIEGFSTGTSEYFLQEILVNEGVKEEEVLNNTPRRWVKALQEQLRQDDFEFTTFPSDSDDMIILENIPFSSLCAHHLLPFFGYAHIGYIPQGRIAGLSKLSRLVQFHSKGLWVQEELTQAIADDLEDRLTFANSNGAPIEPKGVIIVMEAEHTCMSCRGTKAVGAKTKTSSLAGVFKDNTNLARSEFLRLIK